jgi:hypothetical protein
VHIQTRRTNKRNRLTEVIKRVEVVPQVIELRVRYSSGRLHSLEPFIPASVVVWMGLPHLREVGIIEKNITKMKTVRRSVF